MVDLIFSETVGIGVFGGESVIAKASAHFVSDLRLLVVDCIAGDDVAHMQNERTTIDVHKKSDAIRKAIQIIDAYYAGVRAHYAQFDTFRAYTEA